MRLLQVVSILCIIMAIPLSFFFEKYRPIICLLIMVASLAMAISLVTEKGVATVLDKLES